MMAGKEGFRVMMLSDSSKFSLDDVLRSKWIKTISQDIPIVREECFPLDESP